MKKTYTALLLFFWIFSLLNLSSNYASAASASLFLSPKSGTYKLGSKFTVNVMLNSGGGVGVNAAEGLIKYDPALILVSGIAYSNSIFELWTTKPAYSNTKGEISFAGGSPDAYTGSGGTIFTVTFNVLKKGTANVNFSSGMALAADGKGTNILSGYGNGQYVLEEEQAPKPEPKPETKPQTETPKTETVPKTTTDSTKEILPPLPKITSQTHPDENTWYSNNNPEFLWRLYSDVTGMNFAFNATSSFNPEKKSVGIGESKKYENVADGSWFFHIRYQNKNGWGETAHRQALIDVTPPESFKINVDSGGDKTNPTPQIKFMTTDKTSGLDKYKVDIDGNSQDVSAAGFSGIFTAPVLLPGEHTVSIAAYDLAQNSASTSAKFFVEPLKPPVITEIPKIITNKDQLIIRGTSFYPEVRVKIYLGLENKQPEEFETTTDAQGNWSFFHNKNLEKNNYEIWAKIIDKRGAESTPTGRYYLTVIAPSIIELYGLYIIAILIFIILALIAFIVLLRDKYEKEIERARQETEETRSNMGKVFNALKEEVDELIEFADKKAGVTESEKRVRDKLKEALEISEEFISKDIEDVEKELK